MTSSVTAFKGNPKNNAFLFVLMLAVMTLLAFEMKAQTHDGTAFPVPKFNSNTQFYLQRTTDANTVMYDLNIENGALNEKAPIKPYWIRYTENGAKKSLSGLQSKFAFGVRSTKLSGRHYKLQFAAYDKIPLHLKQLANGSFQTSVQIDGQELVLQRLYIHIEPGGSFWAPNVRYIEFMGKDIASGKSIQKRIVP